MKRPLSYLLDDIPLGHGHFGIVLYLGADLIFCSRSVSMRWFCIALFAFQVVSASDLSLEMIFKENAFRLERFGPARWLDDQHYTTVERSDNGEGWDIVKYDAESGARTLLVTSKQLTPNGADSALYIDDYHWSDDKNQLLVFTNSKKVWRYNTRGDYWVLDLKSGRLNQLGGEADESSLMFAKFDPAGDRVAYVRERNVYVEQIKTGKIIALTTDDSDEIVNGTSDWVYEEEFGLRDAFQWSPDGKYIAYWRFDTKGVGTFYMIDNLGGVYSKPIPLQYPKVGTTNSAVKVGVVSSDGGEPTWFKLQGDPRNHYIPRIQWAANSNEVLIQQMNRLQNRNHLFMGKVEDGSVRSVMIEKDDAWVDIHDDLKWLDNGSRFTWLSERGGWRHLFSVSRDGSDVKLLTPGEFDIVSIVTIDDQNGFVYIIASPDNATRRFLYRVSLADGAFERLTPSDQSGVHRYQISPGGSWAFHTYSSHTEPPVTTLVSLPDHRVKLVLEDNASVRKKLDSITKAPVEFFKIEAEPGVFFDAWMVKPPQFDPSKSWPLFIYVYGEPAGQTVMDSWGGQRYLWHQLLAQKGYVVLSVDNRGTPGPLGRAWRKSIYGQIGIQASIDQANAVQKVLEERPYLDKDRVGVWGWSGGGSMTLNALFRYPDLYKMGIAIAFVSNQKLYDTIYQERYMGLPETNPEGFEKGSPITYAENLKGDLLLIHGTGDDNVHYQSFEYLVDKLIAHNKHFAMMSYPNRSHSISERENTRLHLYTLMTRYIQEHLPVD